MQNDPFFDRIRAVLEARPVITAERADGDREAAVALVLRNVDGMELLMIKRAERDRDPWSGHMALPGGRRADNDVDLIDTALRETHEELGVAIARNDVLGALDDVHPRSTRVPSVIVAPFVVRAPANFELRPDPREVETALWVPLAALRDPAAVSELVLELGDFTRKFPSIVYREYTIWGLTHRILTQFIEVANEAGA